jgi:hypothetical protein
VADRNLSTEFQARPLPRAMMAIRARKQLSDASSAASSRKDSIRTSKTHAMFLLYSHFVLASRHRKKLCYRRKSNLVERSSACAPNETPFLFYPIVNYGEIMKSLRNFSQSVISDGHRLALVVWPE